MRKALLVLLWSALTLPQCALGAIAFDNSSSGGNYAISGGTDIYQSQTVNSNTNGIILACIHYSTTAGVSPITAATYASTTMTSYKFLSNDAGAGSTEILYLRGEASGTNNLHIATDGHKIRYIITASYTGVNQSTFPDADGTGSPLIQSASTDLNVNITSLANNAWGILCANSNTALGAGTNTFNRVSAESGEHVIADTNAAQTPAGTFAMNESFSLSVNDAIYFSIAPAGASTAIIQSMIIWW